eukprot:323235-Rhodomonas_salina.2
MYHIEELLGEVAGATFRRESLRRDLLEKALVSILENLVERRFRSVSSNLLRQYRASRSAGLGR